MNFMLLLGAGFSRNLGVVWRCSFVDPMGIEVTRGREQIVQGAVGGGVNARELPVQQYIMGFCTRDLVRSIEGRDAFGAALIEGFFV